MSGLILRLREIASALPSNDDAASIAPAGDAAAPTWHDSTLELERGLDVVELSVESVEPESKADPLR